MYTAHVYIDIFVIHFYFTKIIQFFLYDLKGIKLQIKNRKILERTYYTYFLNRLYAIYKEPLQARYRPLFLTN